MAEVAELPVIRWIAKGFGARPQPIAETLPPIKPPVVPPVPVTVQEPRIPRDERRAQQKAEYEQWKAAERQTSVPKHPQATTKPAEVVTPPATEVKPANQQLLLTRNQIPWLERQDISIPLELMTFKGTSSERFLFADFIHGRKLTEAAAHLVEQRGVSIDSLTFTHLTPEFLKSGRHPYIKLIHDPVTNKPIYCIYNPSGPRVYIMRRNEIQGFPVIIRIAACDKERQIQVLTTISNWKAKRVKREGKN